MSYYPFTRKSQKWTTKFGLYMLCIAAYNSFVLWRQRAPNPNKTYLQHLTALAEYWTSLRSHPEDPDAAATPRPTGHPEPFSHAGYRTRKDDPPCRLNAGMAGHFLGEFPQVGKKEKPTRPCRVCLKRGQLRVSQADAGAAAAAAASSAATASHSAGGGGAKKRAEVGASQDTATASQDTATASQETGTESAAGGAKKKKKKRKKKRKQPQEDESTKRNRAESRYFCKRCLIPLHVVPCFELYHTRKDYAHV